MTAETKPHPAQFSDEILDMIVEILADEHRSYPKVGLLLDPFAGAGRIHEIQERTHNAWFTVGVELEPEWAAAHPNTQVGDSRSLAFPDDAFDAIATSPAYGNRMADLYDGRGKCRKCSGAGADCQRCEGSGVDQSKRRTYRLSLGRTPSTGSTASLQWGNKYRTLHEQCWAESVRVLRPGGIFVLNSKDHHRKGERAEVTNWHVSTLVELGLSVEKRLDVDTPHYGFGQNADLRYPEEVVVLRKEGA